MRQLLPSEVLREQRLFLQCGAKGGSRYLVGKEMKVMQCLRVLKEAGEAR